MKRLSFVCLAGVIAYSGACAEDSTPSPELTVAAASPPRLSASNVVLTLAPRLEPSASTTVRVQATFSGLAKYATVVVAFTGDTSYWGQANLTVTSKANNRWTFEGTLEAPSQVGHHDLSWSFVASPGGTFGAPIQAAFEVTCSDGVFCNGEERWTVRGCVIDVPDPCIDGVSCTTDVCDETTRTCELVPNGQGCTDCAEKNCNPQCKPHQQCGPDGCGDLCKTTATDGDGNCLTGFCVEGLCKNVSDPGTCANPKPLEDSDSGIEYPVIPIGGAAFTMRDDSSLPGFDLVKLSCGVEGNPDVFYQFTVQEKVGLDIRTWSQGGDPSALDTVIAIHGPKLTGDANCDVQASFPGFCSDDASPPGGYGSRVYGPLDPGTYYLVVSSFSPSQVGPFQARVRFVPACVPVCDGKFCGDDGCAAPGDCGDCTGATSQCDTVAARCVAPGSSCTRDCQAKECGPDGCGGSCGDCPSGSVCGETEGRCAELSTCDHMKPVCKQKCGPKSYCGADCECHALSEVLVDLAPAPGASLTPSIEFEWRDFSGTSCAIAEGCVPGAGRWLLMRFTTDVVNYGLGTFVPGDPLDNPEFFDYHECHQHFHFTGFANFALKSADGKQVLQGRKLSYCMEDSYPWLTGPTIGCDAVYNCENQGIQAGWVDTYASTLDCQWLVLRGSTPAATDIQPGWYVHETCTNTGRYFHEHTYDNNCVQVPVYIPDVPDNGQTVRYVDVVPP